MNNSFPGSGFGRGSSGFGSGRGGFGAPGGGQGGAMGGLWETMEQLREAFERRVTPRMGRGDVRSAILSLLAERPMHGYQIIQEIEERSGGTWKPSPGSVYPTLQLLSDEGLIRVEESGGRKTYALTEEGQAVADAASDKSAPWEAQAPRDFGSMSALPKAGVELAQAAAQIGRSGTPDQVKQAVAILEDARRRIYSILAQD